MKTIKEFIYEGLTKSYNQNNSLAEYLIVNCDYKYIVKPLLEDNFENVVNINSSNGIDFTCSNDEYQNIGIIYSPVYRKEHRIDLQPKLLNNDRFNLSKKAKDINYLAFIYDDKLCLANIRDIDIKNYSIDIEKVTPDMEFNLSNEQKDIYNKVYEIYDNLSSDEKNDKHFKKLEQFTDIQSIL